MNTLTRCTIAVMFICQAVRAGGDPFNSVSFDEACKRAEVGGKIVFVDFYTTWCAPCKIMDKTTFADDAVNAWLKENTFALRIDAEQEVGLAEKYAVHSYPTLLFAKADGTEMGRITGAMEPQAFLDEARAIKSGKDPITRAKEKLIAAGENSPMARIEYARTLVQMGKYKEALDEFLWCFDEGNKHLLGFAGVRLSFLLSDIARLGDKYPPALEALRQRRDAARERIILEKPKEPSLWNITSIMSDNPVLEFAALNRDLGDEQETLALYDKMRMDKPDWPAVAQLRKQSFDQLLRAKRYAEIAEATNIQVEIERKIAVQEQSTMFVPEQYRGTIKDSQRRLLIAEIGDFYEVLIGVRDFDGADMLANRALKIDDSAETYQSLARHGYSTGAPTGANLSHARKAYDLTKGQSAAIVDTLARILHALEKKGEACDVLQEASKTISAGPDRDILTKCFADLKCRESD